jgi:hypothetical protein
MVCAFIKWLCDLTDPVRRVILRSNPSRMTEFRLTVPANSVAAAKTFDLPMSLRCHHSVHAVVYTCAFRCRVLLRDRLSASRPRVPLFLHAIHRGTPALNPAFPRRLVERSLRELFRANHQRLHTR